MTGKRLYGLSVLAFSAFDIVISIIVPYLSCLAGAAVANIFDLEKANEVFIIAALILIISANLLQFLDNVFHNLARKGGPDPTHLFCTVLTVLSFFNLCWLIISIRGLVRASTSTSTSASATNCPGPGSPTLGATPIGFFVASLLFTCSKFIDYIVLYMVNVSLRMTNWGDNGGACPPLTTVTKPTPPTASPRGQRLRN